MRRFVRAVLASIAVVGALSTASTARAQELELTGPLKGAPAARHLRLYRQGRLELAPTASFTLLDEYRRTILLGARLNYNITDWIAVGVWGADGAITSDTSLATEINNPVTGAPRDPLTAINVNHSNGTYPFGGYAPFTDQTAKLNYVIAPQITFIPFRGKLAIFNKIFVDADFYIAAGGAAVGIHEREDCAQVASGSTPACTDPKSFTLAAKTKIAPTGSVGFTFYPGDWFSFGVEYRALPFAWNRAGFDSRGSGTNGNFPDGAVNSKDETFRFNQMVTVSIGISIPFKPKVSE
jgi:outer membrane beta-barrel protein